MEIITFNKHVKSFSFLFLDIQIINSSQFYRVFLKKTLRIGLSFDIFLSQIFLIVMVELSRAGNEFQVLHNAMEFQVYQEIVILDNGGVSQITVKQYVFVESLSFQILTEFCSQFCCMTNNCFAQLITRLLQLNEREFSVTGGQVLSFYWRFA